MAKKVLIVNKSASYETMFEGLGFEVVNSLEDCDLVCFTGGADVGPEWYCEKNVGSYTEPRRDFLEAGIWMLAKRMYKPCVGICRGGQFLNVMNGGSMWQNVNNHAGPNHPLFDKDNNIIIGEASSTHHQMMRPDCSGDIIAHAGQRATRFEAEGEDLYYGAGREERPDGDVDVEIVHYPNSSDLCFQPHPEMFAVDHECPQYFKFLLKELLDV